MKYTTLLLTLTLICIRCTACRSVAGIPRGDTRWLTRRRPSTLLELVCSHYVAFYHLPKTEAYIVDTVMCMLFSYVEDTPPSKDILNGLSTCYLPRRSTQCREHKIWELVDHRDTDALLPNHHHEKLYRRRFFELCSFILRLWLTRDLIFDRQSSALTEQEKIQLSSNPTFSSQEGVRFLVGYLIKADGSNRRTNKNMDSRGYIDHWQREEGGSSTVLVRAHLRAFLPRHDLVVDYLWNFFNRVQRARSHRKWRRVKIGHPTGKGRLSVIHPSGKLN